MPKAENAPGYTPTEAYTQADWDEVSDNPPLTEAELASARSGPYGMPPEMAETFLKHTGRPKDAAKAVPVSLRVPPDVLAAYKARGPGWQTRMNEALAAGLRPETEVAGVKRTNLEDNRREPPAPSPKRRTSR